MPISEPFVGTWDIYAGPTQSELILKPDGSYSHSFWGGAQGHWGTWSVENLGGNAVLVMQLQGAAPTQMNGPLGPQPIQWPVAEQWAIASVQPNQMNLYGALMIRRFPQMATATTAPAGGFPDPVTNPPATQPPVQVSPPMGQNAAAPPVNPAQSVAGLNLSPLGSYMQPPPPMAAPAVHQPQVLNHWQNLQFNTMQTAGSSLFTAPLPPAFPAPVSPAFTQQMLSEDNDTAINIFKQQHAANLDWFNARAGAILDEENARHTIMQKYIAYAGR